MRRRADPPLRLTMAKRNSAWNVVRVRLFHGTENHDENGSGLTRSRSAAGAEYKGRDRRRVSESALSAFR